MSKYEKISLVISSISLIVSAIAPFAIYRYLQNSVREQQIKASALETTGKYSETLIDADGELAVMAIQIGLKNSAELPIGEVELSLTYREEPFEGFNERSISIQPPSDIDVKVINRESIIIKFKHLLPPKQITTISLTLPGEYKLGERRELPLIWAKSESQAAYPIILEGPREDLR